MWRQQMHREVHKKTVVSLYLPKFGQAAEIQIIAQVSPRIDTVLPLEPLLTSLPK
jgi:hypothetical protein